MINETIRVLKKNISGERAYRNVEGITRFHRVQASKGYREAADFCMNLLGQEGINVSLFEFHADENTRFWTQRSFCEWNCRGAFLTLTSPEQLVLSDYQADKLSIVQRSIACDFRDRPVDVVRIELGKKGACEEDLEGKIIFISEDPNQYLDWIAEKKIFGVITDYMSDVFVRQRNDIYDGTLFLSFTWMNQETDKKTFSFIVTPRMGDRLRKICFEMEENFKKGCSTERYPKVGGYIDSEFKDGTMEDVVAVIPGELDEEIVLIAHLCHAQACANDNASGCGGAIEIMKTIHDLIECGALSKPKRSIRLLLVPEVVGTYAYLAEHEGELGKIKAGIDIDMIGRKQEGECGMVGIMGVPDSTPSFVQDLAAYIVEESSRDIATFNIDEYVTPVYMQLLNYVGGSDHYVLCDPSVGIPCPIMMQWLDSNYHSSEDTIDKIDPKVLKKTCGIAAAYLYTLADLQIEDIWFIMNKARERYAAQIMAVRKEYAVKREGNTAGNKEYATLEEQINYRRDVALKAAEDYRRFFSDDDSEKIEVLIEKEKMYIRRCADELIKECEEENGSGDKNSCFVADSHRKADIDERFKLVPVRLMKGPITFVGFWNGLGEDLQKQLSGLKTDYPEFYGINSMNDFILHRVDGKYNVLEIAKGAAMEGRLYNTEYVYQYLRFLENAGLVAFPV